MFGEADAGEPEIPRECHRAADLHVFTAVGELRVRVAIDQAEFLGHSQVMAADFDDGRARGPTPVVDVHLEEGKRRLAQSRRDHGRQAVGADDVDARMVVPADREGDTGPAHAGDHLVGVGVVEGAIARARQEDWHVLEHHDGAGPAGSRPRHSLHIGVGAGGVPAGLLHVGEPREAHALNINEFRRPIEDVVERGHVAVVVAGDDDDGHREERKRLLRLAEEVRGIGRGGVVDNVTEHDRHVGFDQPVQPMHRPQQQHLRNIAASLGQRAALGDVGIGEDRDFHSVNTRGYVCRGRSSTEPSSARCELPAPLSASSLRRRYLHAPN